MSDDHAVGTVAHPGGGGATAHLGDAVAVGEQRQQVRIHPGGQERGVVDEDAAARRPRRPAALKRCSPLPIGNGT